MSQKLRETLAESGEQGKTPFEVWNHLCKDLGFDDRVMFGIAGISWLPWVKNQSFDYFLEKKDEDADAEEVTT